MDGNGVSMAIVKIFGRPAPLHRKSLEKDTVLVTLRRFDSASDLVFCVAGGLNEAL